MLGIYTTLPIIQFNFKRKISTLENLYQHPSFTEKTDETDSEFVYCIIKYVNIRHNHYLLNSQYMKVQNHAYMRDPFKVGF